MAGMIDTHTHLYDEAFNADRDAAIARAMEKGVKRLLLPNIDASTVEPMMNLCHRYKGVCFPMIGLHPTSVGHDFEQQLTRLEPCLKDGSAVAIGETGIDLYWDKQYLKEQIASFRIQIGWAKKYNLPLVIHCRNSYHEIIAELKQAHDEKLRGVFHCFPGNERQADEVTAMGFMLGIGGVVTYKNAEMAKVVRHTDISRLLTETDAPYLPPVPHRGKRNESAYLTVIVQTIAALKSVTEEEVAFQTEKNAQKCFFPNSKNLC
ncbi:MAG: TatD family hydrolase [Bacteroidales bacterium]|jgi:TatD DNase family protein|nr:TatD family hydrolase [Bacteroidales bacterium]